MEELEIIEPIYDTFELLVARYGALGIAAAMFAESSGVPFASAIVLLTSGSMILRGTVSFWAIFFASTIGITLGSIFSYMLGLLGSMVGTAVRNGYWRLNHQNPARTGRKKRSSIARLWDKYGNFSIFMGQFWGFTRTFISFPAGAMHMNLFIFIIYTFCGGAIFSLLTIALSIALTGTMGLTLRLLRNLGEYSPLLLFIPFAVILILVYGFRFRGWKIKLPFLKNFWKGLSNRAGFK